MSCVSTCSIVLSSGVGLDVSSREVHPENIVTQAHEMSVPKYSNLLRVPMNIANYPIRDEEELRKNQS